MVRYHLGAGVCPVTLASSVVPEKSVVGHPSITHIAVLSPVVSRTACSLTDDQFVCWSAVPAWSSEIVPACYQVSRYLRVLVFGVP